MMAVLSRIVLGAGALAIAALASRNRSAGIDRRTGVSSLDALLRQRPAPRKKPPEAGLPVPAIPPHGPLPNQGGAVAPLESGS
jgi:hypothetical protein